MTIQNRSIKELKQIGENVFVYVHIYHSNGKYCATVNKETHEHRNGYVSTMTMPFDAVSVTLDAGRYSDKRLARYADAILPNLDAIVTAFLEIDPEERDEQKRRALAQVYFWNPTANIA